MLSTTEANSEEALLRYYLKLFKTITIFDYVDFIDRSAFSHFDQTQ
jgi:hypothetical protein